MTDPSAKPRTQIIGLWWCACGTAGNGCEIGDNDCAATKRSGERRLKITSDLPTRLRASFAEHPFSYGADLKTQAADEIERLTAMWTAEITVLRGALNAILDMEGEEGVTDAAFAKEALRHARSALGD